MGNDLRARVQTLARLRRGRIGVSDRWDSSGGTARDNYLTGAPYSRQFGLCARAASGHAEAAPPSSDMNSRRLMRTPSSGLGPHITTPLRKNAAVHHGKNYADVADESRRFRDVRDMSVV